MPYIARAVQIVSVQHIDTQATTPTPSKEAAVNHSILNILTWLLFIYFFWQLFFGLEIYKSGQSQNLGTEIIHAKSATSVRIIISKVPITLGEGRPLFTEKESAKIHEVSSKPLSCGILQVTYACK